MNRHNLKFLAGAAGALIALLIAVQLGKRDAVPDNELLFPELRDRINDVTTLTITRAGDESPTVISKSSDNWVITSRDDYPADTGKLKQLMLQISAAKIIERKTSNPELHGRLGLRDPAIDGSKGTRLQVAGADLNYDVVVGNVAQPGSRYVRKFEDAQSWLIDEDPDVPDSTAEWMVKDIVDLKSGDVRSVTIVHADGEEIRIGRESAEVTDFDVADIPDGRELSYATVANGIAGALAALKLDDVRKGGAIEENSVSTIFETFAGERVVVLTNKEDGGSWISVSAAPGEDPEGIAASVNERTAGWQFKIADYKANQLTRRWDDILKAETEDK